MTVSTDESRDRDASRSGATDPTGDDESESSDAVGTRRETTDDDGTDPDGEDAAAAESDPDDFVLRPFETDDRAELFALYELATGDGPNTERFDRRFLDNPFNPDDGAPILVAERDDELVGAHLSVAFRIRVGTDEVTALRTFDSLVHPEYRETDLSERLSSAVDERYADSPTTFAFDFLDEDALADSLAVGYRVSGEMPTYRRIQNPAALTADSGAVGRALGRLGRVAARGYLGAKRRRADVDRALTVSRVDGVPAERLAALSEREASAGIRAVRDAEFYDWRFGDAETYRTYVAARDGETVAAVVVADRDDENRVELVDVLPTGPADESDESDESDDIEELDAVRTLLVAIAEQHADADLLTAFGAAFPERAMRAAGFVRGADYPLSLLTTSTTLVTYPYVTGDVGNADSWRCGGEMLTDGTIWTPTFAEGFSR